MIFSSRSATLRQDEKAIPSNDENIPDPALIIGLCLAFWRKGGAKVIPPFMMQMLMSFSLRNAACASAYAMITGNSTYAGLKLEIDFGEYVHKVSVSDSPSLVPFDYAAQQVEQLVERSIPITSLQEV